MKELYVFCEGLTEQAFCNQVLQPHLFPGFDGKIHTIKIAHNKHHGTVTRGGIGKYATLRRDIVNTLKSRSETDVHFTSMIDLYGLPKDFPGKSSHSRDPANPEPYVVALEHGFGADINDRRFVPHLQLHEYETLLFTGPDALKIAFDHCESAITGMKAIVESVPTVEHINDDPLTAPSKRIVGLLPAYNGRKPTAGPDIAEFIGMTVLRSKCRHFSEWIARLERLWC